MKTIKVSEATGPALDWLVAKCEVAEPVGSFLDGVVPHPDYNNFHPSTNWSQGGQIIEEERICIDVGHDGVWLAYSKQNYNDEKEFMHSGPTPLIAAMRVFVSSKLGNTAEVPEELT